MKAFDRLVHAFARALIDRHGIDAGFIAATKADKRLALGDTEGAAMWRQVKRVIEELQDPEGGTRH